MQNNKEIKCSICGNEDNLNRWVKCNQTKIMEQENVCFNCAFWLEKIALTDENTVVVNGVRYTIGDENSNSPFKGFGGREFNIEFFDGRKVTSHNMWYQGEIPERFRSYPELQDNARFIPKENKESDA
jgi:hypothetical protein